MTEKLLQVRKQLKKKKPTFIRQDSHKKVEVKKKWRSPRGLHNKMRLGFKGYRRSVSTGWRSPKLVRHLHKSGLKVVSVSSPNDLNIDAAKQGIIISAAVGLRKKVDIIKIAVEKNIKILNVKDAAAFIKSVEENLAKRKEKKKTEAKKKEEKMKEREKKAKEKEKKKDELAKKVETEEEKQKREKEEKDKLLTKRV